MIQRNGRGLLHKNKGITLGLIAARKGSVGLKKKKSNKNSKSNNNKNCTKISYKMLSYR